MKKRTLLFCGILCALYFILCKIVDKNYPQLSSEQGNWSQNIVKAQHFLYSPNKYKFNCLLGSSLAARLIEDSLPKNLIVLGLNGQGVLDGLDLISLNSSIPDTLFIEINVIQRERNKNVIEYLGSTKIELGIKEQLIFLQERFVPIGLAVTYIEKEFKTLLKKNKIEESDNINQAILESQIGLYKKFYNRDLTILEKEVVNEVIKKLKSLEEKSVKIVFFEMPIHCSLENMELPKSIRKIVNSSFPKENYRYVEKVDCDNYQTTDGIHLSKLSSRKFSSQFRDQICQVGSK
jgi:hypothetical protein